MVLRSVVFLLLIVTLLLPARLPAQAQDDAKPTPTALRRWCAAQRMLRYVSLDGVSQPVNRTAYPHPTARWEVSRDAYDIRVMDCFGTAVVRYLVPVSTDTTLQVNATTISVQ